MPSPTTAQTTAMAIDTPSSSAPYSGAAQDAAVALAQGAGVKGVIVTYTWSSLEPTPGHIDVSELQAQLSYYHQKGMQILLGIQLINTVKREVPSDLETVAFDDPRFIARFHALLDAVKGTLTGSESSLSIGNEVDVYLQANPGEWSTYTALFNDSVAYVHANSPGLAVGVTTTFGGYAGDSKSAVQALNAKSDVVILTYYPLVSGAQVGPATSPSADLPVMVSLAGSRPVLLQEAGYPSGTLNGSSETAQAAFVTDLYQAWHQQGDKMPFMSYFLLYDFDTRTCSYFSDYYGVSDPAFLSYLCTLGLRRSDGTAKPAWSAFTTAVP